jgi:hypothetical protein
VKHQLRKEKNCLNCGTEVTDRFCAHCGQENLETKESFGQLVGHFFADITHYDSKFFTTIKDLLFKPGFLTRQYFVGRRTKYLNPLRMYFFISFIFFLVSYIKNNNEPAEAEDPNAQYANIVRQYLADSLRQSIKNQNVNTDSIKATVINQLAANLDSAILKKDTTETIAFSLGKDGIRFTLTENKYNNVYEYDSAQRSMPDDKRDKGVMRWMIRTNVNLKSRYGSRSQVVVAENFQHSIPKLMFVLLPLFAWFIYLFYSRKKYYYTQHVIFSIHFHSFFFLVFLCINLLGGLPYLNKFGDLLFLILVFTAFIYLLFALKHTYGQSFWLSAIKALSISIIYILALVLGIVGLAFISFFNA